MGVFVAGVPSSLARRTPFFSRSPSPSPFTPAMQASGSWDVRTSTRRVSVSLEKVVLIGNSDVLL